MLLNNEASTSQQISPADIGESKEASENGVTTEDLLEKSIRMAEITSPTMLAWSSHSLNNISVIELENKQNYTNFEGVQLRTTSGYWTHVKEIPGTKLLVSLNHNCDYGANMAIFDLSRKNAKAIYTFEEVAEMNLMVADGDVTFNARRNILGSICLQGKIAYHLHGIHYSGRTGGYSAQLFRKSKWHEQCSTEGGNHITSFDFNPSGETIATLDLNGVCLVSDVNTDSYHHHVETRKIDYYGRCRWSTNSDEPLLFVKYDFKKLNILDSEKKIMTLKEPMQLDPSDVSGIDVCPNNGNLLALGGTDKNLKIFDKRESKLVKTFEGIHSYSIVCVRWSPNGEMLASAGDQTAKLLDFKTGKVLFTGNTSDGSNL